MPVDIDEGRLDDVEAMQRLDASGMLRATATSAAQLRESADIASERLSGAFDGVRPRSVVVCGMGGSGIAGSLLQALGGSTVPMPVLVHRGPDLPGWVGAADLVVGVSCSGRTRETLTATAEAARRGAYVVGVGGGGSPLAELVGAARGHYVEVSAVVAPRATLWALTAPLVVLGQRLGLLEIGTGDAEAAATRLESVAVACAPDRESFVNPGKDLALTLVAGLPIVWGSGPVGPVAALRLGCQLAENAKQAAVTGALPEAHHNQVVCLDGVGPGDGEADDFFRDRVEAPESAGIQLVLLRDDSDPAGAAAAAASRQVAEARSVRCTDVVAEGESAIERLASLVALVDFASVYLALLRGLDPTPIAAIDDLKAQQPPPPG